VPAEQARAPARIRAQVERSCTQCWYARPNGGRKRVGRHEVRVALAARVEARVEVVAAGLEAAHHDAFGTW
jgi:ribosomal protein L9